MNLRQTLSQICIDLSYWDTQLYFVSFLVNLSGWRVMSWLWRMHSTEHLIWIQTHLGFRLGYFRSFFCVSVLFWYFSTSWYVQETETYLPSYRWMVWGSFSRGSDWLRTRGDYDLRSDLCLQVATAGSILFQTWIPVFGYPSDNLSLTGILFVIGSSSDI